MKKKNYLRSFLNYYSTYFDHWNAFKYSAESLQWPWCGGAGYKKVIGSGLCY